jgi:hypothetical protein
MKKIQDYAIQHYGFEDKRTIAIFRVTELLGKALRIG